MKIAYLVHSHLLRYSGGGAIHVREVSRALQRLGHEVICLGSDSGEALDIASHRERQAAGAPGGQGGAKSLVRRLLGPSVWQRLRGARHAGLARSARPAVEAALRHYGADAVYERYSLYNPTGVEACAALGLPHVLEVNSLCETLERYGDHTYDPRATAIERQTFEGTGAVLVVSAAIGEAAMRHGIPAEKVHVVPNGVDVERFHPDVDASELRDANGLADRVVVGMVAYFKRWHGLERLCAAVPRVVERAPDVQFLLVGEGDRPGEVADFVHMRGLSPHVSVTGEVTHDAVPDHVAAMDIAVIPDFHHHGSPLKLFEYMAAGKPTVAVAVGQIRDLLGDGGLGVLFEPDDTEGLVEGLVTLAHDAARRDAIGRNARSWVEAHGSWEAVAGRIVALFGGAGL